MNNTEKGKTLLALARSPIAERLGLPSLPVPQAEWLQEHGATFVTLTQQGDLRGCIGSLQAHRPLHEDVRHNAIAAAFRDPRFAPLTLEEFSITTVEVSLLSAPQAMSFSSEQDALAQLRPEVDGVIIEFRHLRGTFLPQVWEQLPEPRRFMAHLKNKAGLPVDFWSEDIKLSRYTVQKWREKAVQAQAKTNTERRHG